MILITRNNKNENIYALSVSPFKLKQQNKEEFFMSNVTVLHIYIYAFKLLLVTLVALSSPAVKSTRG